VHDCQTAFHDTQTAETAQKQIENRDSSSNPSGTFFANDTHNNYQLLSITPHHTTPHHTTTTPTTYLSIYLPIYLPSPIQQYYSFLLFCKNHFQFPVVRVQ
jgi:hypothetical protein